MAASYALEYLGTGFIPNSNGTSYEEQRRIEKVIDRSKSFSKVFKLVSKKS